MYCPSCGTEINEFPCRVCGAQSLNAAASHAGTLVYAGWWHRVGATFFDNLVLFIPEYAAFLLGDAVANESVGVLLLIIVQACYLILLLARPSGQTVGNRIVGTRVRDAQTGQPITRQQSVRRWVLFGFYEAAQFVGAGNALSYVVLLAMLVDFLYPLMNEKKQTWHDRFAGTVVVRG
jgi:uncharacterized RDD family membrane protein YckC